MNKDHNKLEKKNITKYNIKTVKNKSYWYYKTNHDRK